MSRTEKPQQNFDLQIEEFKIDEIQISTTHSRRDLDGAHIQARITELAQSIQENGLLNPITIKIIDGQPHVAAGVLRLKACQRLGYEVIPCVIHESDADPSILFLVENMQREDLTAIEKAEAIKSTLDATKLSQSELGAQVGLSNTTISDYKRVADMPEALRNRCRSNKVLPIRELKKIATAEPEAQDGLLNQLIHKYNSTVKAKNSNPRSNEAAIKSAYAMLTKAIGNHSFADESQKTKVLGELEAIFRRLIPQEEVNDTEISPTRDEVQDVPAMIGDLLNEGDDILEDNDINTDDDDFGEDREPTPDEYPEYDLEDEQDD